MKNGNQAKISILGLSPGENEIDLETFIPVLLLQQRQIKKVGVAKSLEVALNDEINFETLLAIYLVATLQGAEVLTDALT